MKKVLAIVLCLMLLCLACTAFAVEKQPGETVTVTIKVSGNSNNAVTTLVKVSGSDSVFEFVDAKLGGGMAGSAPKKLNANFNVRSGDLESPLSGTLGTITLRVKEGAAPGSYSISLSTSGTYDGNGNKVSISVSGGTTVVIPEPKCEHNFGAWTQTDEPTCTEPGEESRVCGLCGDTETREVAATGHSYDDGVQSKAPTCKEEGEMTFTCGSCGDSYTDSIPKSDKHDWDDGVTVPATCLVDGSKTFTCSVCGLEDKTVIKAPGKHTYDESNLKVDQAPTCTENGKGSYTCTACGEKIDGGVIEALGHDKVVTTTNPSCGTAGKKVTTCSRCDFEETEVIPATGKHTPGDDMNTDVPPTCTEDGKGSYECTVCGAKIEGGVIEKLGHEFGAWTETKAATCTAAGEETRLCTRTGCDGKETRPVEALGHDKVVSTNDSPTCGTAGKKVTTCTRCDFEETEVIPATGKHTPGDDLKEEKPTCQKAGYKYYTCTVCGTEVKEADIPKVAHDYQVTEETPATCTTAGKRVSACSFGCGKTKTETLKKLGHKMGEWTISIAPTCTEKGEETRVCENGCGKTETRAVKASHSWGEWIVDEEAGTKTHICSACEKIETKNLATNYIMTVSSYGIRFRDLENPVTNEWYMFTPIDLSVDGEQTIDLIAGNMHKIGTATVLVKEGTVTVTTKVSNIYNIAYEEKFLTFIPSLADVTELDFDTMTNYAYGEAISIEEALGGDTKVLLLMRNHAWYEGGAKGVESFEGKGKKYDAYVEELKQLMD